ncbi:VanY-A/VanY-F/VanY-M family D-Ala-D-Ala carboxypeptidase [Lentibacillus sediminis]|uniref:VanY-A/VanY-F/VanY-M family D-Ala-D-Ala carboxypeptidase n=1 Tax=Lentibacillus sediminis TaxID=1940529 RepID=UPI000C1C6C86|nr:VanY-A/VanY-F/VanY-M family D-Ala-D-Ala carboxypeptidase [Lentibacillus sediminis]
MKKWFFYCFLLLALGFAVYHITPFFEDPRDIKINQGEQKEGELIEGDSENTQKIKITEKQIYKGKLLLVNREYPVRKESVKTDIINLFNHRELTKGYGLLDDTIHLSKVMAQKFSKMVDAAREDGVNNFLISSGFRSFERQNELYEEKGADYALPAGHSEHNLGLAVDVGSTTQMSMYNAPEAEWIDKNAWKYGFILRYPANKVDITGIEYEPWHIRYVGLPHSAIMKEKNFALEEYLDYLKEEKEVSAEVEGEKFTVTYYPFSENMTINIPEDLDYEISGDNIDGVIVTVHE